MNRIFKSCLPGILSSNKTRRDQSVKRLRGLDVDEPEAFCPTPQRPAG
jgi:hypothetical protein